MQLTIDIGKRDSGVFTVSLGGPLDTATYLEFEKAIAPILSPSTKAIVLNMQGVNYISSLGLGAIFKVANAVHKNQGAVLITDLQPQIKKVFDTVKALPESIFRSIEEADEYLNEIQKKALEKDRK